MNNWCFLVSTERKKKQNQAKKSNQQIPWILRKQQESKKKAKRKQKESKKKAKRKQKESTKKATKKATPSHNKSNLRLCYKSNLDSAKETKDDKTKTPNSKG